MSLLLFLALLLGCCGYALIRGGAPERVGAGLLLGAFAAGLVVHRYIDPADYSQAAIGTAGVDLLLLVALEVLAWRSTRFWPLWLAGWQAAAMIGHLAKLADPGMLPAGYALLAQIWAYPMVIALGVGTWRHRRRRRAGDPHPAWKSMPG